MNAFCASDLCCVMAANYLTAQTCVQVPCVKMVLLTDNLRTQEGECSQTPLTYDSASPLRGGSQPVGWCYCDSEPLQLPHFHTETWKIKRTLKNLMQRTLDPS